eukprot:TRINITY_DN5713_c1_g3_i1.p1 TRINITY_DN5713_c1_g3~~TRINITY_DN5713_c1_g3_i1.p1  ORF type:complete len:277 (-),score=17.45 TRINITY_DN5713_c1_g3_i1:204-1034(-)
MGRRARSRDGQTFLEAVSMRLDRLEFVMLDLHWCTVGVYRAPWEQREDTESAWPCAVSCMEHQNVPEEPAQVTPSVEKPSSEGLFAELLGTVRSDSFVAEMADILRGGADPPEEGDAAAMCAKCADYIELFTASGWEGLGPCVCDELCCKKCFLDLRACACPSPAVYQRVCRCCDCEAHGCECGDGELGLQPAFITEDMYQCGLCGSFADPESFEPCDSSGCLMDVPGLAHRSCMTLVPHPQYEHGALMCRFCFTAGKEPFVDSGSDEDRDNENGS